jgi:hypothetical protein
MTAAPLRVLLAKNAVEELFWKEEGFSKKVNALVILGIVFICFLLSIFIDSFGEAVTLGASIIPMVNKLLHL